MPYRVTFIWRRCSSGSYERLSKRNTVWGTRFWEMDKVLIPLKIHSQARKKINAVKKSGVSDWFIVSNISVNSLQFQSGRSDNKPLWRHKQATLLMLMCSIQNHAQMWKLGSCASCLWISYHSAWGICNVSRTHVDTKREGERRISVEKIRDLRSGNCRVSRVKFLPVDNHHNPWILTVCIFIGKTLEARSSRLNNKFVTQISL